MPLRASGRAQWRGGDASTEPAGSHRRALVQLAAAFVGLGAVASQLPGPRATLGTLSGSRPVAGAGGVADAAMLSVAAMAVWLLLAWMALTCTAALAGRLPGVVGSAARAGLVMMAPVALRNVLLTVVGASVVTGLAGCTVGTSIDSASGSAGPAAVSTSSAVAVVPGPAAPAEPTAAASTPASQYLAERLIGIATLRISDRIAVEGSAVRSAGAAPADSGPTAPSLDWPGTAATSTRAPAAVPAATAGTSAPAATSASAVPISPAAPASPTAPAGSTTGHPASDPPAPTVSVDWPGPPARGAHAADASVVVLRGDSLWTIAARSLPAGADDATVDRTWRAWYAANTSVIGSDPNYLLPGQILQPPTTGTGTP